MLINNDGYALNGKLYDLKNKVPYCYESYMNWIITGDDIHFVDSLPKIKKIYFDIFKFEGDYMQIRSDSGKIYDLVRQQFSKNDSMEIEMLKKRDAKLRNIIKFIPK